MSYDRHYIMFSAPTVIGSPIMDPIIQSVFCLEPLGTQLDKSPLHCNYVCCIMQDHLMRTVPPENLIVVTLDYLGKPFTIKSHFYHLFVHLQK